MAANVTSNLSAIIRAPTEKESENWKKNQMIQKKNFITGTQAIKKSTVPHAVDLTTRCTITEDSTTPRCQLYIWVFLRDKLMAHWLTQFLSLCPFVLVAVVSVTTFEKANFCNLTL